MDNRSQTVKSCLSATGTAIASVATSVIVVPLSCVVLTAAASMSCCLSGISFFSHKRKTIRQFEEPASSQYNHSQSQK